MKIRRIEDRKLSESFIDAVEKYKPKKKRIEIKRRGKRWQHCKRS